jgi:hypothetical protein
MGLKGYSNGGARKGAGRPRGSTGQRPMAEHPLADWKAPPPVYQNIPADLEPIRVALLAQTIGTERDPLVYLLNIVGDEKQPTGQRLQAAGMAMRFVHPARTEAKLSVSNDTPAMDAMAAARERLRDQLAQASRIIEGEVKEDTPVRLDKPKE